MSVDTAVCLVLLGVSLLIVGARSEGTLKREWLRHVAQGAALTVALVGLFAFNESLLGLALQADQPGTQRLLAMAAPSTPGRMVISLSFLLLGSALLLLSLRTQRRHVPAQLLALATGLVSLVVILGQAFSIVSPYGTGSHAGMAWYTAVSFLILSLGIVCAYPECGLLAPLCGVGYGGFMGRRLLPAVIGVPIVLGWLRLEGHYVGLYADDFGLALFVVSNIVVFGALLYWTAKSLDRAEAQQKRTEGELQHANNELTKWVRELEQRTQEMSLLDDLGDLLQTCINSKEAYSVIARQVPRLFPTEAGALFVLNASRNILESAAVWGECSPRERVIPAEDCWALRRGRVYAGGAPACDMTCQHVVPGSSVAPSQLLSCLCVPMVAHGDALGVLQLHSRPAQSGPTGEEGTTEALPESTKRLAAVVAEHVGLALANLRLRETLRDQSIRDPLTGLFNRRYMEESLERELQQAARKQQSLGVMMFDIDHFKLFNDSFGHDAGDAVLHALGRFLRAKVRGGDIACRYGGEEFTVILPEASREASLERARQLLSGVKQLEVRHQGRVLKSISLSIGVANYSEHGLGAEELLRAADAALYRAKAEGRDRVITATVKE